MSVDGFVAGASPDPHSEFVPTADIPPLELTPLPREETKPFEPKFDISSVIPHVDILPEQFGFKSSVSHEAANSWLPPLPRTNEPESPLPFFYPDGQYEVSSVYPQAQQYPTQVPSVLLAGSFNFSYQPPAPASYVQQASYSFGLNGTMLEDGMGQGYGGEYDLGQYFDFDSLLSQA
ncbi:hypothetical protein M413DRAFT_440304 [Hebeloma cylindrosporum]|uniref:Uncharacterized protein n=1 Tax=Hebeloma cylindrosporum TaxID=76867 RepID=A0A0C3CRM7_HEBCY|nr:hypothetical protein M413DRAFT_440304 [Hebeloma cylindrosporum h7]